MSVLLESDVPGVPCWRGKVRDVYDLGDRLVLVATDRISVFDRALPTGIPDKGRMLTALTLFWLDYLAVPNHVISTDLEAMGPSFAARREQLEGRSCLVKKTAVVPIECVVRGYLAGSGWKEYQAGGTVCGISLQAGLRVAEKLQHPIFTPATKEKTGDDQNIQFANMSQRVGEDLAADLRWKSLDIYERASEYAERRGLLLADTKLEWGLWDGKVILIDEVLTPDSSRYWPAAGYEVGKDPESLDKQYVCNFLRATGWDGTSPPPELPPEVVERTREKYVEVYQRLTGQTL